jgi:cytochrome P450
MGMNKISSGAFVEKQENKSVQNTLETLSAFAQVHLLGLRKIHAIIKAVGSTLDMFITQDYERESTKGTGFLGARYFLVNAPSDIKRVLLEEATFPKHRVTAWIFKPLIGASTLAAEHGAKWRAQRNLVENVLREVTPEVMIPRVYLAMNKTMKKLSTESETGKVNAGKVAAELSWDVTCQFLFGMSSDQIDISQDELQNFAKFEKSAAFAVVLYQTGISMKLLSFLFRRKAKAARELINRIIHNLKNTEMPSAFSVLNRLIGEKFSHEKENNNVLDQLTCLSLPAGESMTVTTTLLLYLLGNYPEHQHRLREEANEIKSLIGQENLTQSQLKALVFANSFLNEALRLYPPIPVLYREAASDAALGDVKCPFKSMVFVTPWVLHRHKSYWAKPLEFDPERFISNRHKASDEGIKNSVYIPFGLGQRRCPGESLAKLQLIIFLVETVRHFEVIAVDDAAPEVVGRISLKLKRPLFVKLRPIVLGHNLRVH